MVRQGLLLNLELVRLTGQQSPAILVSLLPQCGLLQACAHTWLLTWMLEPSTVLGLQSKSLSAQCPHQYS